MKSPRLCLVILLASLEPGSAATVADSVSDFNGVQGENNWFYGYRNLAADGGGENYNAATAFIPFAGGAGQGAWSAATQQFDAAYSVQPAFHLSAIGVAPYTIMGAEFVHPNASPEHWAVRRQSMVVPAGGKSFALTWKMGKQDPNGGNGVTGAIYIDGQKADEATIPYHDSIGITRTWYHFLPSGAHTVDLVLKARGTDGDVHDWYDGVWQSLVISDNMPSLPLQPDGSLFIPLPIVDTDGDGLPDVWENDHAGNLTALGPAPADRDGDGQSDAAEYAADTSPMAGSGPVQRWSFNEKSGPLTATELKNEVTFSQKAVPKGWGLRGTGRGVSMPGGNQNFAGYIDLPNRIVSRYDSCTIEGWVSVDGGGNLWARIFDLGDSDSREIFGNGGAGSGMDYIILTAPSYLDYQGQLLAWRDSSAAGDPPTMGASSYYTSFAAATTFGRFYHFAVTVESLAPGQSLLNYWRDGVRLVTNFAVPADLRKLHDVNCWLGRTQWNGEGLLNGTFDEFRIYPRALSETEVLASRAAGPDAGLPDADGDGLPDYWERMFTAPESATALSAGSNTDGDGLTALLEYQNYSDPTKADTDDDGMNDGAEVTAGRPPNLPTLTSAEYTQNAASDWNSAANWNPVGVPNNTATEKFLARSTVSDQGDISLSGAVTVTQFDFGGNRTLKPAGAGASLTVEDTLRMGGRFTDMGTVNAGSPQRGGIQITYPSRADAGSNWLEVVNTTLVNKGPDGIFSGEESLYFRGGAKLVNEGGFLFSLGASFRADDGNPGNAFINRGRVVFDAQANQAMGVNTRSEGGLWDLKRGTIQFSPIWNGSNGYHPGSVSHFHEDATFRLAQGTTLQLNDNTTTTVTGNSFIEGDGKVLVIGGDLRQEGDNLAAKNMVLERGKLSGTTNANLTVENLELRSGTVEFAGTLNSPNGFKFRNKQDFSSGTGLTLRQGQLNMLGTANSWEKTDGGGLTLGSLVKIRIWPNAVFLVKGHMPSSLEPGALNTEFLIDGDLVLDTGATATLAPPVNLTGRVLSSLGSGDIYMSNGARLGGTVTLGGNNLYISSGTVDVENFGEVQGLGTVVVGHSFSSVPFHINAAAGFSAPNLDFYGADVDAPAQRTIFTGNLTTRAGSRFRRVNLEVAGGMKMLTSSLGGNYIISLRDGTHVYARGPGSLFRDWGVAGQGSDMVLGEGSVFENFGEMEISGNRLAFSPVTAASDGPPRVSANSGAFFNQGTLKIKCLVVVHPDVGYSNWGTLRVENGGSLVLQGRLDNGGDLIITGVTASMSVDDLVSQANAANAKVAAEDGGFLGFLKKLFCGEAKASNGGRIDGPALSELQANKVQALDGGIISAGGIVAPGAGGGALDPYAGSGIIASGAGGQVISKGQAGIVAAGAGGVIYANIGGQIVAVGAGGNIVAAGAGSSILAKGGGSIKVDSNGNAIIAAGAGAGIKAEANSRIEAPSIVGTGAGANIVAAGAGAGIIAPGAGGNIVAPGAGIILQAIASGLIDSGGRIDITGQGSGIIAAGAGIVAAGAGIQVGPQAFLTGNGGFINTPLAQVNGLLGPGNTPGIMTINGNLELSATSRFETELGGTSQGVDYDFLDINGTAALAGRLEVVLYDGFVPDHSDTFTVLATDQPLAGSFGNISSGRVVTRDGHGTFAVSLSGNDVVLSDYQATSVFGYSHWVVNSGHFTPPEQGDPGVSGETADPDGDSLPNVLEYAYGLDPRTGGDPGAPRLEPIEGGFRFVYTRAKNIAGTFSVETSTTLAGTTWTSVESAPFLISEDTDTETWGVVILSSTSALFARLRYTP